MGRQGSSGQDQRTEPLRSKQHEQQPQSGGQEPKRNCCGAACPLKISLTQCNFRCALLGGCRWTTLGGGANIAPELFLFGHQAPIKSLVTCVDGEVVWSSGKMLACPAV